LKHGGLALATVLGEGASGVILAMLLHRRLGSAGWKEIAKCALRCLGASAVMACAAIWVCHAALTWGGATGAPDKVVQIGAVSAAIGVAMVVYLAATLWMGAPEIHDVVRALRRRLGRKPG
jgi:peptidoglycan biosynthesis protein MviN/MurJ (putative lipid II flippase)